MLTPPAISSSLPSRKANRTTPSSKTQAIKARPAT
jgi:hypothetical protein